MTPSKTHTAPAKDAAKGRRFGIVVSRYHEELTRELLEGAERTLLAAGAAKDAIYSVWVPGAFEISIAVRALLPREFDAILCLGIIIKGETTHDEYIARETARGISALSQVSGIPIIFGVLTVQTLEQAKARCGGDRGHKGTDAAEAAVEMIHVLEQIKKSGAKAEKSVGFSSGL